ncbi:hypothetical protein LTR28_001139 [Elasticomyces elasticus]|nr:hypothetical protein LTR28_001139 [Elasticomyces elasticus]
MPEWDPFGGQAPREIEIESGDLDFSGLEEADLSNICFPSAAPITPADTRDTAMTDLMRADLDQVFFDRVHPVLPIIYHRRYFSWANKEHPGATRACLRSAMRAMAAAMSAPGRRFCDQLYTETRDLLEAHKIGSKADISVEYVQAWLLLAHYELLRSRVFWLSFCLDRSLCLRNEYPLTLQEDMPQRKRLALAVDTRLRVLGTSHGSGPLDSDPMLLFAHMLAHSAVIRLGHAAQRSPSLAGWRSVDKQGTIAPYRNRALNAAVEMVHLARQIPSFSAVRAHPFLPDPVGCAVGYLTNPTNTTAAAEGGEMAVTATEGGIQDLLRLLRAMQDKNGLASANLDGTWRNSGLGGGDGDGKTLHNHLYIIYSFYIIKF